MHLVEIKQRSPRKSMYTKSNNTGPHLKISIDMDLDILKGFTLKTGAINVSKQIILFNEYVDLVI